MATEKWRFVWKICEQARQLPAAERIAYVHANAANPEIARDALSLLIEPEESVFPSWEPTINSHTPGGGTPATHEQTLTGLRIGRYVVGGAIGRGATGDVYSAMDTELERRVAMKFFRPGTSDSRWKIGWLLREAKTASALNAPGIITVYEVIQSEAGLAIVMEFVDGTALRRLCTKPNSVDKVIRWGSQIADALAIAHQNGIIHRDIKPENIMIRDADGLLKLLDFGIAQSSNRGDEDLLAQIWAGTLPYMSPEQASGETVTAATDVFSLGVVLYELLTGRNPFRAETMAETLRAIRCETPAPPSRLRPELTKPLSQLILEMLAKGPDGRPTAAAVAGRLRELERPRTGLRSRYRPGVMVAALAAALIGGLWFATHQRHKSAPIVLRPVPLTTASGFHTWPDISPNGESVVYGWAASPGSYTDIYLQRFDQDAPIDLVKAEPGARIGHAKWSPDGQHIYFKSESLRPGSGAIWVVSKDGRDRHEVFHVSDPELSSGIDVSSDGKRILYADRPAAGARLGLRSFNLVSHERTVLTAPQEGWGDWDPRFSPDGKAIAFKRVKQASDDQLYVMPTSGGTATQITSGRHSIFGDAWLTDDNLLLSMQWGRVIHGLWRISVERSTPPDAVYESGFDATMPAVGKNKVVWIDYINDFNIYSVPLAGGTPVERIASPMFDSQPTLAPDGRIAYTSRRSGRDEIWIEAPDLRNEIRLTNLQGDVGHPAWSPDGSRVAFTVERNGVTTVFSADCTPGELRCGSPTPLFQGTHPSWSADGQSFYFSASTQGEIRKAPSSGGAETYVVSGLEASASRDGRWLYFRRANPAPEFWRVRLSANGGVSGPEERVLARADKGGNWEHWTLAGNEIVFWDDTAGSTSAGLHAYSTVTKRLRTIVETPSAEYPAISPDGKTLWFAQSHSAGATVMAADLSQ